MGLFLKSLLKWKEPAAHGRWRRSLEDSHYPLRTRILVNAALGTLMGVVLTGTIGALVVLGHRVPAWPVLLGGGAFIVWILTIAAVAEPLSRRFSKAEIVLSDWGVVITEGLGAERLPYAKIESFRFDDPVDHPDLRFLALLLQNQEIRLAGLDPKVDEKQVAAILIENGVKPFKNRADEVNS